MTVDEPRHCLGLDLGGANLKLYHSCGAASSMPFAMWLQPADLAEAIIDMVFGLPRCTSWAVTMTGEMADVFTDRRVGVIEIVDQTTQAARRSNIRNVGFYALPGQFVSPTAAKANPLAVASANWHALASWVSTTIDSPSLLVDVGSTTVDLIAVSPGCVDTQSKSDHDRLSRGELVYMGIRRTPVCALVDALDFRESLVPVVRERFATTDDCAILLGWTVENAADKDTCDSQPRTRIASAARLSRMIGLDRWQVSEAEVVSLAQQVMDKARATIARAAALQTTTVNRQWILSGHANKLIPVSHCVSHIDLGLQLGIDVARVAPAFAVCKLWQPR